MKKYMNRTIPAVVAALLLAIPGCVTPSADKTASSRDADLGFWMACMENNVTARSAAAQKIAEREFTSRRKTAPGDSLDALRGYLQALGKPAKADTAPSAAGPAYGRLSSENAARLRAYIAAHPEEGSFNGSDYSKNWAREIEKTRSMMAPLERELEAILEDAGSRLAKGDLAGAGAALDEARRIDRNGASVVEMEKRIVSARAAGGIGAFASSVRNDAIKKADAARKIFGTPESGENAVSNCVAMLDTASGAVNRFRATLSTDGGETFSSPEVDKGLVDLEKEIAALRGICWAEQIRLMSARGQYWQAYEFAAGRLKDADAMKPHEKSAVVEPAAEAYGRMLTNGLAQYVNDANRNFSQDAYGIALVLCRMGEEMAQFAKNRGIRTGGDTAMWIKRCVESRMDTQKRIDAMIQRRILIGNFTPAGRENDKLAAMVLERCRENLAASRTNAAAWGVTVEKAEKAKPSDYLIECNVPDLAIVELPPVEAEREIIKVGRDITETPNPFYHPEYNKHTSKTVFSQEVFVFQRMRKKYEIKARLTLSVNCSLNNSQKTILSLNTEFGGGRNALEGVTMAGEAVELSVPFLGTPRMAETRKQLAVDPWPKAEAVRMPSEGEIDRAVQAYAVNAISESVASLAAGYPVNTFAADALKNEAAGNAYDAANCWGQCLEYCFRLAVGDKDPADWFAVKAAMARKAAELRAGYWKDCDKDMADRMSDLWKEAVQSVLSIQASGR